MKHLRDAKMYVQQAESVSVKQMQAHAQLAIAHALIALIERTDKATEEAEAAAEREDLIRERLASRQASERIL